MFRFKIHFWSMKYVILESLLHMFVERLDKKRNHFVRIIFSLSNYLHDIFLNPNYLFDICIPYLIYIVSK